MKMLYSKHVKFNKFRKGEVVLKVAMDVRKETNDRKTMEKWERLYLIGKALGKEPASFKHLMGKRSPLPGILFT